MIYDLPLVLTVGRFDSFNIEVNKTIKEKIEALSDFEKKLTYYNDQIRSLSTFSMEGEIYFKWGNPDQRLKIYCGCTRCRSLPDFNAEHEQIFFKLRTKEVERMVVSVSKCFSYGEKLAFLFQTKGYIPDKTPKVFANAPFNGNGNPDREMWLTLPVIDLVPTTKEEREIYNEFVRLDFVKECKEGSIFSKGYNCFDFTKERKRFEATLKSSIEPLRLVEYLINKIEKHFGYPENINAEYNKNHLTKKIGKHIEEHGLVTIGFTKMVLGVPIDLNEHVLNSYSLMQYTHIEQVFKFYKYLKILQTNSGFLTTKKTIETSDDDICNVPFIGDILHYNLNISKNIEWESQVDIASLDELIIWFNQLKSKEFEQLIEGLGTLEKYINKNVHEDVKANLARLKQLNRNLTNWKHQIKSVFIEPIKDTEPHANAVLDEERRKAITRLENKIEGALEIIHLRINDKEYETIEFEKPTQVYNKANLFCGPMPLKIAKEHFIVFTEQKSKNGKPFLTTEQFNLFIQKAFCGKSELPKQRFNQAPHREKGFIVKRFYEFYFMASTEYEKTTQCQEKYIKLLTENFENWEYQDIKNNFSKKVNRNW